MTLTLPPEFWTDYQGAVFGGLNRMYRYLLWRRWSARSRFDSSRMLLVVMVNPSTADHRKDDSTIRRLAAIAKFNGFDGIVVVNLCAFRSSKVADLYTASNPTGPDNDNWIDAALAGVPGDEVLVAWGDLKTTTTQRRALKVLDLIRASGKRTYCLVRTRSGYPKHPLYCKADSGIAEYHGSHEDELRLADAEREKASDPRPRKVRGTRRSRKADAALRAGGDG